MSNENTNKTFKIISRVLTWTLVVVTVLMTAFTIISMVVFDKNDRSLFGLKFYVVLSDSMSLSENNKDDEVHFNAGDIVLISEVEDPRALQAGDIISFVSMNDNSRGQTITHRIRQVNYTESGKVIGYTTYGTNTGKNDQAIVEPDYVIGTYTGKIPKLGSFFNFLKSTKGYIICILVPFMLLIGWVGFGTVRLLKQYKGEQRAVIEAEHQAAIDAEREQSAAIMQELQALREQLARQTGGAEAPAANTNAVQPTETEAQKPAEAESDAADRAFNKENNND